MDSRLRGNDGRLWIPAYREWRVIMDFYLHRKDDDLVSQLKREGIQFKVRHS